VLGEQVLKVQVRGQSHACSCGVHCFGCYVNDGRIAGRPFEFNFRQQRNFLRQISSIYGFSSDNVTDVNSARLIAISPGALMKNEVIDFRLVKSGLNNVEQQGAEIPCCSTPCVIESPRLLSLGA
jgi:hypothetical protein